jgi:hypothetical protein
MYLAMSLGYKWVLQMDDDSSIRERLTYNIVSLLNSRNAHLGARIIEENHLEYAWGLPELAKFYLISENIKACK